MDYLLLACPLEECLLLGRLLLGMSVPGASAHGAVVPIAMPVDLSRIFRATTAADNTSRPRAWLLLKFVHMLLEGIKHSG